MLRWKQWWIKILTELTKNTTNKVHPLQTCFLLHLIECFSTSLLIYTFKFKRIINWNKCALNKILLCWDKIQHLQLAKITFRAWNILKRIHCRRMCWWWCALFFRCNVISRIFAMKIYYHSKRNETETNEKEIVSTTFSSLSLSAQCKHHR